MIQTAIKFKLDFNCPNSTVMLWTTDAKFMLNVVKTIQKCT